MQLPTGRSSADPELRKSFSALREFLRYNLPAGAMGILILVLTLLPGTVLPEIPTFLDLFKPDKLVQVAMFGGYFYFQAKGFSRQQAAPWWSRNAMGMAWLFAVLLSLLTEVLQATCIPLRNGSWVDFVANLAGCVTGMAVYKIFSRRFSQI